MMDETSKTVTTEMCALYREVINEKIQSLKDCDAALDGRMDGIDRGIEEVRILQKTILYTVIFIALTTIAILIGVILGRGFDFGLLIP